MPTGFASDNILSEAVSGSESQYPNGVAAGLTNRYTHSIDATSSTFPVRNDGTELCFAMRIGDDVSSGDGAPIVQPANRSTWGQDIAPGAYHQLDFVRESENCLVTGPGNPIYLIADGGGSDFEQSAS
jgi:hypothetical protein